MSAAIILIVEDEPLVRAMACDIAEAAGFLALAATGAAEAIDVLETAPGITILFSDVQMPGPMNGKDLAHEARARWPDIKIILTSGYNADGFGDVPPDTYFLAKPYRPDALERLLTALSVSKRSPE